MEEERLQAIELERQKEEEKLREEKQIKNILHQQMMELKEREHEVTTGIICIYVKQVTVFE